MRRRIRTDAGPSSGPRPRGSALASHLDTEPRPKSRPIANDIPAAWLAKLLAISCALPIEDGPEAVASELVLAVDAILPGHAFGVSFNEGFEPDRPATLRIVRPPRDGSPLGHSPDPNRLFPEFTHERVIEMKGDHASVRLHIAGEDAASLREDTAVQRFVGRVAEVLSTALRTTKLVTSKGRESLELKGQIIQSEKLASLGQIAAGVVHELNNPLTSIVGYSEYLRAKSERDRGDPNDIERLRRIAEAAGRILRFSRDLMAYARPSIEPPAPVAIHAIVDQAFVFCEHVLGRATIRIERKFAPDVRPVLGVRDQLTQVFVNLITNACHAMEPQGGTLSIETALNMQRHAVRVVVSDTGSGIDAVDLKRIFDPFFTTKTEGRGTGLGLSIVRNIVLLHSGSITVESTSGAGTSFVLELPIAL